MTEPPNPDDPQICPRCEDPIPGNSHGTVCPKCQLAITLEETRLTLSGGDAGVADLPELLSADPRYQMGLSIAKGGMGEVIEARELPVGRRVAMKVIHDRMTGDAKVRARFIEEAQITGQLEHPSIVPMHDLSIDDRGQVFYTMKRVEGQTLAAILQQLKKGDKIALQEFPLSRLLTIFQKICDAVAFAHSRGVIHRDLKPENFMVGGYGEVLVMDWGLAKVAKLPDADFTIQSLAPEEPSLGRTMDGTVMGTIGYMPPEQARGDLTAIGFATDIYALGAILYEILTLRRTVETKSAKEGLEQIRSGKIEPIPTRGESKKSESKFEAAHCPGKRIPESLAAVTMKALSSDPDDRYASVEQLQAEIEAYQSGFATEAEQASLWRHLRLFVRRHKIATSAAAAVLVAILAGFVIATVAWREAEEQRELAVDARNETEEQRKVAVDARRSVAGLLSKEYIGHCMEEWEQGNLQSALWWALEAHRTVDDAGDLPEQLESGHRLRISSLLRQLPRMRAVPETEFPVTSNVAWTEDGRWAVAGHLEGQITIFDTNSWEPLKTVQIPGEASFRSITRIDQNRFIAFTWHSRGYLLDIESTDEPVFERFLEDVLGGGHNIFNSKFRISPDRMRLAMLSPSNAKRKALLVTWDLTDGKVIAHTEVGQLGKADKVVMDLSPDGHLVAFSLVPKLVRDVDEKHFEIVETESHKSIHMRNGQGWAPASMAFHPDGHHIAIERDYKWIEFRNLKEDLDIVSRTEVAGQTGVITDLEFIHGGNHLLANREGMMHHFQRRNGLDYEPLFEPVRVRGWGPIAEESNLLVVRPWEKKGSLRMVDIDAGRIRRPSLEGGSGMNLFLDMAPDGQEASIVQHSGQMERYFPTSGNGWLRIWDLSKENQSEREIRTLLPPLSAYASAWPDSRRIRSAVSFDGSRVFTAHPCSSWRAVILWDAEEMTPITAFTPSAGNYAGFGFLGTSRQGYLGWRKPGVEGDEGNVFFVDGETGALSRSQFKPFPATNYFLYASADGSVLAAQEIRRAGSGSGNREVIEGWARFWRLEDHALLGSVSGTQRSYLTLSRDGEMAFLDLEGGSGIEHVRGIYYPRSDKLIRIPASEVGGFVEGAWYPDMRGSKILPGNRSVLSGHRLYGITGEKAEFLREFRNSPVPRGLDVEVAVDADGKRAAISTTETTVTVFDIENGETLVNPIEIDGVVARLAFSPDGGLLAVGTVEGQVDLLDSRTGDPVAPPFRSRGEDTVQDDSLNLRSSFLGQLTFSGDGRRLLISTTAGGVYLWDVPQFDTARNMDEILAAASLAAARKIGGDEHGDPLSGDEWQENWVNASPEVRAFLLQDPELDSKESDERSIGPWIPLFDSPNLEGWTTTNPERFLWKDGQLTAREGDTKDGGEWLTWNRETEEDQFKPAFEDFELRGRIKAHAGAKSGLRFHVDPARNPTYESGIEIEISGGDADESGIIDTGKVVRATPGMAVSPHRSDTWFDFQLRVEGSLVSVYIDDRLTEVWRQPEDWQAPKDWLSCELGAGTFAIHAQKGTVELRDLRVRRLNVSAGE